MIITEKTVSKGVMIFSSLFVLGVHLANGEMDSSALLAIAAGNFILYQSIMNKKEKSK